MKRTKPDEDLDSTSTAESEKRLRRCNRMGLLNSGKYSDFTISCKGQVFKVHKAILGPESEVLDRMFNSPFKESEQSLLVIEKEDPANVRLMLSLLYGDDCPICADRDAKDWNSDESLSARKPHLAILNPELWVAPNGKPFTELSPYDKSDVCAVKHFNKRFLELTPMEREQCRQLRDLDYIEWTKEVFGYYTIKRMLTAVRLYAIADVYFIGYLKFKALDEFKKDSLMLNDPYLWQEQQYFYEDFVDLIRLVYASTSPNDRGLKMVIEDFADQFLPKLISMKSFKDTLETYPNLSFDLLVKSSNQLQELLEAPEVQILDLVCLTCGLTGEKFGSGFYRWFYCTECGTNTSHVPSSFAKTSRLLDGTDNL